MIRVACIGSREIDLSARGLCCEIGEHITLRGWYISTGGALGADLSFASGGNQIDPSKVIIYLPWSGYNQEHIVYGNKVTWRIKEEWIAPARRHHAIYDQLSQGVQKLMCRNIGVIWKADACLALFDPTKKHSGTQHGWAYAGERGIPRLNLTTVKDADEVFRWLDKSLHDKLEP